jgi:cell division protein FtsW (lipid II flippase)
VPLRKVLSFVVAGFFLGVGWASFLDWGWPLAGLFFVLTLALAGVFWLSPQRNRQIFLVLAVICLGFVFGLIRFSFYLSPVDDEEINNCVCGVGSVLHRTLSEMKNDVIKNFLNEFTEYGKQSDAEAKE